MAKLTEQVSTCEVSAEPHWRIIDFISDLHLEVSDLATFAAWQHYMADTQADALFILGDLFEVWVGDDVVSIKPGHPPGFEAQCQRLLFDASQHLDIFFIPGNRDFLLGNDFAQAGNMTLLPDPSVLLFDAQRWLLSHGDALCLGDTDYQQFRLKVRNPTWRDDFLGKPLAERQIIARSLREQSEARKSSEMPYADVDKSVALQWLDAAQASTLIHGHTHRPGNHTLGQTADEPKRRLVLSDWNANTAPPRLEILRLHAGRLPERVKLASGL